MSPQTTAAQSNQTGQSGLPARLAESSQPMSDDTILVWREVKYHHTTKQHLADALYADFREVFDGWSKERFQNVHPEALRALKYALRSGGVYTGNIRKHSAEALADLAQLPCAENGVWPHAPQWDNAELLTTKFKPGAEAQAKQLRVFEMLKQRSQRAPTRQILPPQQPVGAPSQAPPGPRPPAHNAPLSARQPASAPAQAQPSQVPPPRLPFPGPVLARPPPPVGFPTTGGSQRTTQGSQQQRGPQLNSNQTQSNSNAAQPPPPYSRHGHGVNDNSLQRPAFQPMFRNPFSQPELQRAATNSGSQMPTVAPLFGPSVAQNGRGNGNGGGGDDDDDSYDDFDEEENDF